VACLGRRAVVVEHDGEDRDAGAHRRLELEAGHSECGIVHEVDAEPALDMLANGEIIETFTDGWFGGSLNLLFDA